MPYRTPDINKYLDVVLRVIDKFKLLNDPVVFTPREKIEILFSIVDDVYLDINQHDKLITKLLSLKSVAYFQYHQMVYKHCRWIKELILDFKKQCVTEQDIKLAIERRWANA